MEIKPITKETAADLRLPNEPFSMPGRFIPALENGVWSWREELWETPQSMVFPDEDYDFDTLSRHGVLLGAYEDGACLGLAIFQEAFFKYLYLYDLKVTAAARGRGVGRALIRAGLEEALAQGYRGLYTQAQDNNLNACRFYLKAGFAVGGFDNRVYEGTAQAGKADVIFYLEGETT